MKRNLSKAFTLIELLAVIVILAIIALIATPIILGIVEDARKDADESSAKMYMDAVEKTIVKENMKQPFNPSECVLKEELTCDGRELRVTVSGTKPTSGYINLENGKITRYNLKINNNIITNETPIECFTLEERKKEDELGNIITGYVITGYSDNCSKEVVIPKYNGESQYERLDMYEIIDIAVNMEKCIDYHVTNNGKTEEEAKQFCESSSEEIFLMKNQMLEMVNYSVEIREQAKDSLSLYDVTYDDSEKIIKRRISKVSFDMDLCINIMTNYNNMSEDRAELQCQSMEEEAKSHYPSDDEMDEFNASIDNDPNQFQLYLVGNMGKYEYELIGNEIFGIESNAFANKNLASVDISDTITSIGYCGFCNNNLTQANKNEIIEKYPLALVTPTDASCFTYEEVEGGISITGYKCADTDVIIPSTINNKNVVKIGANAFNAYQYQSGVSYLNKTIVKPVNHEFAFVQNGIITSVILPDTVTYIDNYAFAYNKITNVYLPKNLEYIGVETFLSNQLTTLTIPDSVIHINNFAFSSNQITTIELSNNNRLQTVGSSAFCNNSVSESSEAYQIIYQLNMNAFTCQLPPS